MRVKIAAVVMVILLAVVLLEVGLRQYFLHEGDERRLTLYVYTREEIQARRQRFAGMAYLNYGLLPSNSQHNAQGYRGVDIDMSKPPGVFRIVALGGSAIYGARQYDWQDAFPHRLQMMLRRDYRQEHVEVINAGAPGYSSWESAVNALLRIPDLQPDLVIIYHGFSDFLLRLSHPDFFDGLNTARGYWRDFDEPLPSSVLLRIALNKLGMELKVSRDLDEAFVKPEGVRPCGLEFVGDLAFCSQLDMAARDVLAANTADYFERNLRSIILLSRAMGSQVLLLTRAYSPLDFDEPDEAEMSSSFMQEGLAEHNAIARRLAAENPDILFYDLAASMPQRQKYWQDGAQKSASGAAEMARQVAAFLDASAGHLFEKESS